MARTYNDILDNVQLEDDLQFTVESILFNNVYENPNHIINLFTLITKKYLHRSRYMQELPVFKIL